MINRITIKNSVKIIDDKYVIKPKKKPLDKTYAYLLSRSFDYFPSIIKEDDDNFYYEYINDIDEPNEQKIIDLTLLLSLLHSKTTFYKEMDIDYFKYIYESINKNIDEVYKYYNSLIDNIDSEIYMSPANYLIARNISLIYSSLNYAKNNIEEWYELIKNENKVRLVTIHNNVKLEHYLKNDKPYLISWDNANFDMPIYDLISLYKNHYLDFDFSNLLDIYLSKYPLTKSELTLFLTIISIPSKIMIEPTEYKYVLTVRRLIDYLYKTKELRKKYSIKQKTDKSQKLDK